MQQKTILRVYYHQDVIHLSNLVWAEDMATKAQLEARIQELELEKTQLQVKNELLAVDSWLFRSLLSNVPDYIYFKDQESRFIAASQSHAESFNLQSADEVRDAYNEMREHLLKHVSADDIKGILVRKMIPAGKEVILHSPMLRYRHVNLY